MKSEQHALWKYQVCRKFPLRNTACSGCRATYIHRLTRMSSTSCKIWALRIFLAFLAHAWLKLKQRQVVVPMLQRCTCVQYPQEIWNAACQSKAADPLLVLLQGLGKIAAWTWLNSSCFVNFLDSQATMESAKSIIHSQEKSTSHTQENELN